MLYIYIYICICIIISLIKYVLDFLRKGKVGDSKNLFSPEDEQRFETALQQDFPNGLPSFMRVLLKY